MLSLELQANRLRLETMLGSDGFERYYMEGVSMISVESASSLLQCLTLLH